MKKYLFLLVFVPIIAMSQNVLQDFGFDSPQNEKEYTCTPLPPPKPPAQMSSGEGVPPLPLPAAPQRRTEKKNPPKPPVLIAKVATQSQNDWATNPSDANNLLKWMAKNLNVNFSIINMPETEIPLDPKSIPLLYRTGHEAFSFSEETRQKIREYIFNGGTIIFDSCCGRKDFFMSAYQEAQKLIPERPPYRLNLDHPIYHSFFEINTIGYREWSLKTGAKNGLTNCLGIDVGCRTAVFIFRWDLSCGWDELKDSDRHHCLGYDIETSKQMGANLMAYITAERSVSMPLSQALEFVDANKNSSGKFTIGQVKYNSIWKTRSAGISMLLNSFYEQTHTPVRFERTEVSLDSPRIFDIPFLYMTGHNEFELKSSERENLKQYILRGGTLFSEACCGRESFDISFRSEMIKIFGEKFQKISNATFLNYPNNVREVFVRPSLAKKLNINGKIYPTLFGVMNNGTYSVIYSPHGLSCGWELSECPYCQGLQNQDSIAIGVNILSYSILQ